MAHVDTRRTGFGEQCGAFEGALSPAYDEHPLAREPLGCHEIARMGAPLRRHPLRQLLGDVGEG